MDVGVDVGGFWTEVEGLMGNVKEDWIDVETTRDFFLIGSSSSNSIGFWLVPEGIERLVGVTEMEGMVDGEEEERWVWVVAEEAIVYQDEESWDTELVGSW